MERSNWKSWWVELVFGLFIGAVAGTGIVALAGQSRRATEQRLDRELLSIRAELDGLRRELAKSAPGRGPAAEPTPELIPAQNVPTHP